MLLADANSGSFESVVTPTPVESLFSGMKPTPAAIASPTATVLSNGNTVPNNVSIGTVSWPWTLLIVGLIIAFGWYLFKKANEKVGTKRK